jgi:outer membrane protein, heavy metal efflux system
MVERVAGLRLGMRVLAGSLLALWLVAGVGCSTQKQVELQQPSPVIAENPREVANGVNALAPAQQNSGSDQQQAAPLAQVSYQAPMEQGLQQAPVEQGLQPAPAPAARQLTLDEVFEHTLQYHPALQAKKEEVQAARARLITAGLRPNPQFVLNTDSETAEDHAVNLNTRVVFPIEGLGKRRSRQSVAAADITRAQWELNAETENILIEAAEAAWQVLYFQELLELEGKLHDLAAKTADLQRSRPDVSYADKIEAETDAVDLELERLESGTALEIARFRLSQAVGQGYPEPLGMRGELAVRPVREFSIDELLVRVQQSRPQLARAQAAVAESEYAHRLACANARPDIGLGPRYTENFDTGIDRLGLRFDTDLPLFNRNQGNIQESAAEIRRQVDLCQAVRIVTLTDAASSYKQLLEMQNQLRYYRAEVIPLADRTEKTIHEAFAAGQVKADQMSILQRNFVRLRLKELALRYQFNRLATRLEIFLGEPIVAQ